MSQSNTLQNSWKLKRRFSSFTRAYPLIMPRMLLDAERGELETNRLLENENGNINGHARTNGHANTRRYTTYGTVEDSRSTIGKVAGYAYRTTKIILFSNYVNVLLFFVPLGIIAGVLGWSPNIVFGLNFMAIIPLAALLSFATEELALEVGEVLGGLMNATFGNAVEMIVSIVALTKGEIRIVQASMLGSILSNILLVLGMCFFFGGLKFHEQRFNSTVASTMSSLMAVATSSLIIPAALYATIAQTEKPDFEHILSLSRGTSIVILILYIMYLFFQLYSHADLFVAENDVTAGDDEEQTAVLRPIEAGLVLVAVTIMVAICAEYLVGSIEGLVKSSGISKTFVGLILIPIVGNAAEHVTAIVVAMKDKMDLAIGVAIGSSMQIALLVTPFLVILGWIIGQPMSLYFQTFETVVFFVSTYLTYYVVQDGKSNYLEGAMLLGIYIIIALSFYVYPDGAGQPGTPML